MPIDKDFWVKLATKHGITKEQAEAIANSDGLMSELNEMAMRRDDFKSLREQTDAEKRAAEQAKADALKKYQENLTWYGQQQQNLQTLDAYRTKYGDLTADGEGRRTTVDSPALDPAELDKRIRMSQREVYNLNKQLMKAARDYEKRFNEDFPFETLEEIAMKPENQGRDFKDIYSEYIGPKVSEKTNADIEARIKAAKDEAYKEGLAKGRLREPTQQNPDEVSPFYATRPKKEDRMDDAGLQRVFVETYDKATDAKAVPV